MLRKDPTNYPLLIIDMQVYKYMNVLILKKNYARTDTFKFSFFNRIVDSWNVLPLSVRQASSISSFKRGVRDFLFSRIM